MGDSAGAPALADTGEEPFLDAAWTEAIEATELLRTVLGDLGLADSFPRLRGDVNVYGRPMVTIGRIEPGAARALAAALCRAVPGRAAPGDRAPGNHTPTAERFPEAGRPSFGGERSDGDPLAGITHVIRARPVSEPLPPPAAMPAPRTYAGPGSTSASDDLQASALRLMRLYGGPSGAAQAVDTRDPASPESWAPMLAAVTRMPARGEVADSGDGHRLPA